MIWIEILCSIFLCFVSYFVLGYFLKTGYRFEKKQFIYTGTEFVLEILLSFVLNYKFHLSFGELFNLLCLVSFLFLAGIIDYKTMIIPNKLVCLGLIVRVIILCIMLLIDTPSAILAIKEDLLATVIVGVFFLLIYFVFKNSIGGGDIKLFVMLCLFQGLTGSLSSLFFSLVISFFVSIVLLILKKKKKTDSIPFGPCVLGGTVISIILTGM